MTNLADEESCQQAPGSGWNAAQTRLARRPAEPWSAFLDMIEQSQFFLAGA